MAEVIEPYQDKNFDLACGSGGMFVPPAKFLRRPNPAVRGFSVGIREANSYYKNPHSMVRNFDFLIRIRPSISQKWIGSVW